MKDALLSSGAPVPVGDVCARCAGVSDTCCCLTPGQEEHCFPVSAPERQAMLDAGVGEDALSTQENTPGFVDNLARLFPGEDATLRALFPLGGQHHRLNLVPAQGMEGPVLACRLLGPQGCILPRQARPYYCRLFPFWLRGRSVLYFEFIQCQAVRERRGPGQMYLSLGMSEKLARELYTSLRAAWGLPARA